jgi:cytochrome c oxidase cbb3-type subunit I/II
MIRPFRSEVERYGEYSKGGEYVYDHPFLWGSRRTGPDLHRIGKKYNSSWHFNHFLDPMNTSPMEDKILGKPRNFMPKYTWFISSDLDYNNIKGKMKGLRTVGVPYTDAEIANAEASLKAQAKDIENELRQDPDFVKNYGDSHIENKEVVAVIAYLQRLGTDIKKK